MKKLFNQKNILREAVVLLIPAILILSTIAVSANTEETLKVKGEFEQGMFKSTNLNNPLIEKGTFSDDFEGYDDFLIDFPPWTQFDGDLAATYGFGEPYEYLNQYYTGSFIIFNPSHVNPPITDDFAHSGEKYAACFNAVLPDSNDDWLITPQLTLEESGNVSFWAKAGTDQYQPEEFRVGVSTTDNDPGSFSYISAYEYPPITWAEYSYNLDNFIGDDIYIGIHVTSYDAFWCGFDDFSVTGVALDPPDLDCEGTLSWTEVEPGSNETGEFTVLNIGGVGSILNWEIQSYPDWGTWTFTPESGAIGSEVTVEVEVIAPEYTEDEFTGEIILVNSDDSEDTCIIDVALTTPLSQSLTFLDILAQRFPILAKILEMLF